MAVGEQLVPDFVRRAGDSLKTAEDLVVRALNDRDTVLVLDNLESILPPPREGEAPAELREGEAPAEPEARQRLSGSFALPIHPVSSVLTR